MTIVVPAKNAASWLHDALLSIAGACGGSSPEVVVVDDASTDGTVATAVEAATEAGLRLRVMDGGGRGPSHARNLGWRISDSEWVQFLDSDDLLAPGKIDLQLEVARRSAPDVAVVHSPWAYLDPAGDGWVPRPGNIGRKVEGEPLVFLVRDEGFIPFGSALVRRRWLESVGGFDEDRWVVEDVKLLLKLAAAGGRFCFVDSKAAVFYYRQRVNSLSRRDLRDFVAGVVGNLGFVQATLAAKGELTLEARAVLAEGYAAAARSMADWNELEASLLARRVEVLVPGFVPPRPTRLRILTYAVGYERAIRIASRTRAGFGALRKGAIGGADRERTGR